jgi:hypothetical protein
MERIAERQMKKQDRFFEFNNPLNLSPDTSRRQMRRWPTVYENEKVHEEFAK